MTSWHDPRRRRTTRRRWIAIAAGALTCYVASYAAFSSWGQYVTPTVDIPTVNSASGPVQLWAPGEFYDHSVRQWKKSHTLVYAPLLWLDHQFWHPPVTRP